ncbi:MULTISPECIES: DUF397 domain-containing protein [Streptomyces]|uniref:DUF397 domain-containing protein n=1 Tax=Streptomyces TaxID=1883 RepID=UPI0015C4924F|nr:MULTISPECIES: DUF397 domain-containing protein [Streptomyces]MDW4899361.1 DUF397 domain-containing protein [Streptomyces californicus]QLG35630.1 DUF397 domain-containing protein [Streptomyces sp. CB04723]
MSDRLAPPTALPPTAAPPTALPPPSAVPPVPRWRRSTRSTGMNNCVEAATLPGAALAVRDSKDVDRPPLRFSATAWNTFVAGLGPRAVPRRFS